MKIKRPITLIELLMALMLLSILLSSLFFFYTTFFSSRVKFQLAKNKAYEQKYFTMRIENILSKAQLPFFTSEIDNSLIFVFDRGISPEPLLSGKVLGKLYLDKESDMLCLGIWPLPTEEEYQKNPSQTFILMENVTHLEFSFFTPGKVTNKVVFPEKVHSNPPKKGDHISWEQSFETLPAFVTVKVRRVKDELSTTVNLPVPILYPLERIVQ